MSGFLGARLREIGGASEAGHAVTLAEYSFPCGTVAPYVEISESHPWYTGERVLPLSTVVHALLNLGPAEVHAVAERAQDWRGVTTEPVMVGGAER